MSGQGTGSDYLAIVQHALAGEVPDDELAEPEVLPFDLAFPEVFFPTGDVSQRRGFDAVLGNPPWEGIRRADNQFFGARDFQALVGATKQDKKAIHDALLSDPQVAREYEAYVSGFEQQDRAADAFFDVHKARVNGELAGRGTYDSLTLFAERAHQLLQPHGVVGWVLPSAFHANEGGTGVGGSTSNSTALRCCYSFENRRKLSRLTLPLQIRDNRGDTPWPNH